MSRGIFFRIDPELKKEFLIKLASNGETLKDVLTASVEDYVKKKGQVLWRK